jgi:GH24 family phage-related lysozyme (muramidase)
MNWYKNSQHFEKTAIEWGKLFKYMLPVGTIAFLVGLGIDVATLNNQPPQKVKQTILQKAIQQNKTQEYKKVEKIIDQALAAPTQTKQQSTFDYEGFQGTLKAHEGYFNQAYDDGTGVITIGVGHAMGRNPNDAWAKASQKAFSKVFGPSVDWMNIFTKRQKLTNEQVSALAKYDINTRLNILERKIPQLNTFPSYLQSALLDGLYRGDLGPNTIALINKGDWNAAANEYINRKDYRDAIKNRMSGIKTRMDKNRAAMLQYAKEINKS